jgi:hypothetical protein
MRKFFILLSVLFSGLIILTLTLINQAENGTTPDPSVQNLSRNLNEEKLLSSADIKAKQEDNMSRCAKNLAELALKLKRSEGELALLKQKARDGMASSLNNPDKANSNKATFALEPHSEQELFKTELKFRERAASLENAFRNEGVGDPEWAEKTASNIENALESMSAIAPYGANVECRSHQCRVELEFSEEARSAELIDSIGLQFSETFSSIARQKTQLPERGSSEILYLYD